MHSLSRSIVELDDDIYLAAVIDGADVVEYYIRPGVPVPNEFRASELALQTTLMMSMTLKGQDYLGALKFVHFHMEHADGLHFHLGGGKTLALMIKPQSVENRLIKGIQESVKHAMLAHLS